MREDKAKELILYIAQQCARDEKFGAVKLNKILYYADFAVYRELGQPISGMTYRHLSEGPVPYELPRLRDALIKEGAASVNYVDYFGYIQERLVSEREPDVSCLTDREIALVDKAISWLEPYSAAQVSELSHAEFGWRVTASGEEIPYRTAWLSLQPLSQEQVEAGQKLGDKLGLLRKAA